MSICSTEPSWREVSSYITPPHQLRVKMRPGKTHDDLFSKEAGYVVGKSSMFLSKFATWIFSCLYPHQSHHARVWEHPQGCFFVSPPWRVDWINQLTSKLTGQLQHEGRSEGHVGVTQVFLCQEGWWKNVCQLGNWYVRLIDSDFKHKDFMASFSFWHWDYFKCSQRWYMYMSHAFCRGPLVK